MLYVYRLFNFFKLYKESKRINLVLGDIVVIVLAIEPKIPRFKPGRGRRIFKSDINP
jgi:hypothetical protein